MMVWFWISAHSLRLTFRNSQEKMASWSWRFNSACVCYECWTLVLWTADCQMILNEIGTACLCRFGTRQSIRGWSLGLSSGQDRTSKSMEAFPTSTNLTTGKTITSFFKPRWGTRAWAVKSPTGEPGVKSYWLCTITKEQAVSHTV